MTISCSVCVDTFVDNGVNTLERRSANSLAFFFSFLVQFTICAISNRRDMVLGVWNSKENSLLIVLELRSAETSKLRFASVGLISSSLILQRSSDWPDCTENPLEIM